MNKQASLGDMLSGPVAIIAIVLILIIFGTLFFGPMGLFLPTKEIVLKDTAYTDHTKLTNLMKVTFHDRTTFADKIYDFQKGEYEGDKLRELTAAYLNNLPNPQNAGWEFILYEMPENKQIFRTITSFEITTLEVHESKHLMQTIIMPLEGEKTLKAELFLRTREEDLSPYA